MLNCRLLGEEYEMTKVALLMLKSAVLLGLVSGSQLIPPHLTKSKKPRNNSPAVDEADVAMLVAGNSAFAFDLYRTIRQTGTNLFFSPYSISEALALAYAGARGDTEKNMAEVLNFKGSQGMLHSAFNGLELQFKQRGQGAKGSDAAGFKLHVVNAIWGQKGYGFLPQFLDLLAQYYGAGLMILDFTNATEQSRLAINKWVSDQTEAKIRDLVPHGAIDHLTRLVLTNAIYFNAAWESAFDSHLTSDDTFHLIGDIDITAPMMQQTGSFRYAEGDGYQAIELPYDGHQLSMVVLLPRGGQLGVLEERLDAAFVKAIVGSLKMHEVTLTMPRFEYDFSLGLKESLSALGLSMAFTEDADFSGMNGKHDLSIQDVLHKAFVSVDEAGTKAAAATAVMMTMKSMRALAIEFRADRPFVFLIRDIPTDSIVFLGRVLSPAE
jgi:serpin B